MSLPLDNGSRLTRKWFGIDSNLSRFSLASLICILMLTLGVGNAWGANYEIMDPSSESLVNGKNYLIAIHDRKSGIYYFIQSGSTKHLSQTVTNGIVSNPNAATIWTATASSTNWQFRKKDANSNGYLYNNGSNTTLNTNNNSATTWYVGHGSSGSNPAYNYFKIQNGSNTGRYICWNGTVSGGTFGAYANSNWSGSGVQSASSNIAAGNGALQIFKEVASYTITAQSNNNSFGTVSLSGTTITATPESGYRVSTSTPYSISPANSATVSQNGNEFTVTPSANTTVTINFEAIPTYTVTLKDDNSTLTQASAGAAVTLPSRTGCDGYTFAGWSTTNNTSWTTTAPTIIPAGSYTPTSNINLYPVYTKTEGGGTTDYSKTETFENQGASTTYNSTQTYTAANSNASLAWSMYYGTVSTNAVLTGSKSAQMRWYSSATSNIPNIKTTTAVSGLQTLTFNAAVGNTNIKMKVEKSTDGSNWTVVASNVSMSTSKTEYSYDISGTIGTGYYIRIGVDGTNSTAPSSGNYTFRVDDVKFDYQEGGGSTTSYISVPNCCTELATINGSFLLT